MNCLVTGGAGYIGGVTAKLLIEKGHRVVVLDDLRNGATPEMVPDGASWLRIDLLDRPSVQAALEEQQIDAVLHFAAYIQVGESMERPGHYFENNVGGVIALLEAMEGANIRQLIYSSTCAIYGQPEQVPIVESESKEPISVYGSTKRIGEEIIDWYCRQRGFSATCLRYFNVAGASGRHGECHHPETHLIPIILDVAAGKRDGLKIFGSDYPTPDGTCVRDYLHVEDLANAHLLALSRLKPGYDFFNLGSTHGYSVRQVVESARRVTGREIPVVEAPRRAGDPPTLVACSDKAATQLGWCATRTLDDMLKSQWEWMNSHSTPGNSTP